MENPFDNLIDTFIDNQVGIADHFITDQLAAQLQGNLVALFNKKLLLHAGTGNATLAVQDKLVRGDRIYWLDRIHNDTHENSFFDLMDSFVIHLNSTCYTGITGYEFHYAMYEEGSFYRQHLDQFKNNDSRKYSMIIYLNRDWVIADGGELCIHHQDHLQNISPQNGKGVFFKSNEVLHEVLVTNKTRMSITGWLKVN